MRKHLSLKIYGLVQGVGFRFWTLINARRLGLTGFVRNESDQTVYVEAEGEPEKLNEFLEWARKGPPGARVDDIKKDENDELKNFSSFSVVRE